MITQYCLRPVELLELITGLGEYYWWFEIDKEILTEQSIEMILNHDVQDCAWVDGLGRRICIRAMALPELRRHLGSLDLACLKMHSQELAVLLMNMIDGDEQKERFVFDDGGRDLPIPVFSSVTPNNPIPFILHVMLILGKYETELDFWLEPSLRESLARFGLIPPDFSNPSLLENYSNNLGRICVEDVFQSNQCL